MSWWITAPVAFLAAVGVHAVLRRRRAGLSNVLAFLVAATGVGLGLIACVWRVGVGRTEAITIILLYGFLCELYIFLFTLVHSSVSASLLLTLAVRSETTDTELEREYSAAWMVQNRLKKLEANRFVDAGTGGFYHVTQKGEATIRLFENLRKFFRHI
jgi:hypothetical protein